MRSIFLALTLALTLPSASAQSIRITPLASGLPAPTNVTGARDGTGRLFVTLRDGRIMVVRDGEVLPVPLLDIRDRVLAGGERGLLGIAFHPLFGANGFVYVNYTSRAGDGDTVVARFRVPAATPDRADPASALTILTFDQPFANHNGGQLQFGPDGNLWIASGDGGSGGDPQNRGQSLSTLLGKILRIDVDGGAPYAIPPDNPFATSLTARREIFSWGLRNPWRFSFDRFTGDLWVADVGQSRFEEINFTPAPVAPANYGWRIMEGMHCFNPSTNCNQAGLTLPVLEYGRSEGCSVTGGYVYRGQAWHSLRGIYFYGDFCSGKIWGAQRDAAGAWSSTLLADTTLGISSFGEDDQGELYVADLSGTIYRIDAVEDPVRRRAVRRGSD